jgi:hypothetical protein
MSPLQPGNQIPISHSETPGNALYLLSTGNYGQILYGRINRIRGLGILYLTPLSIIFQLYCGVPITTKVVSLNFT